MHALKPNTKYKIVPVLLAVPDLLDYEIAGGLNELLRANCCEEFIADWCFPWVNGMKAAWTSNDPVEGELFHGDTTPS